MPEFWELCDAKSRAILGHLYKKIHGHYPDWDERSGKTYIRSAIIIDSNIEPEPDTELMRDMKKPPHSPRYIG